MQMETGPNPEHENEPDPNSELKPAMMYLDEVKRQFGENSEVYNSFIGVMRSFKAETIDTAGVIQKVSTLFRGHPNLLLGFNKFLPPGCKIEPEPSPETNVVAPPPPPAAIYLSPQPNPSPDLAADPITSSVHLIDRPPSITQSNAAPPPEQQPGDFTKAINYVTRIKKRFANNVETYKAFLDILHTYQKEQKSIKEVLDQVSELFRDHTDLLTDFAYFLPDAVREKAKQEISRIHAKRKLEETKAKEKKAKLIPNKREIKEKILAPQEKISQSPITVTRSRKQDFRSIEEQDDEMYIEPRVDVVIGELPRFEKRLFSRIKSLFMGRGRWTEFLKCLELFSQEVLTRKELILLVSDVFSSNIGLLEEFDRLLASRGATDDPIEDAWFSVPFSDLDFTNCNQASPSYRSLPKAYPRPPCSERTSLCNLVLNDTWVAVPTEVDFYSRSQKNPHEEMLFKCEDERYELDMVIDSNLSTMHVLESLISKLQSSEKPEELFLGTEKKPLSVLHLKSIARVYGERSNEAFELLKKAPLQAMPVILQRLKAKDEEWQKQRMLYNETWREICQKNYVRSLDHQGFSFKQQEKKHLTAKNMLIEAKDFVDKSLNLEFWDPLVHRACMELVSSFAERNLSRDLEMERFLSSFEKILCSLVGAKSIGQPFSAPLSPGTKVLTQFGLGTITGVNHNEYQVKLESGEIIIKVKDTDVLDPGTVKDSILEDGQVLIGQSGYLFLRFYHLLCDRISKSYAMCLMKQNDPTNYQLPKYQNQEEKPEIDEDRPYFETLLEIIKSFVNGFTEMNTFEVEICNFLGTSAYFLFTIDKLVQMVFRSVQGMINEDKALKVSDLSARYKEKRNQNTAADLFRGLSDALLITGVCSVCRVKFIQGSVKFVQKPSGNQAPVWTTPNTIIIELLDSFSPKDSYDEEFSPETTDGDILVLKAENRRQQATSEDNSPNKRRKSDNDQVTISVYFSDSQVDGDSLLKMINNLRNSLGKDKDIPSAETNLDRNLSPDQDDSSSTEEIPPAKKRRSSLLGDDS